jgi:hypothetical protein
MRGHSSTNLILNFNFTFTEDDIEESIETAAEGGMLDDLYNILTNTKNQTQCKVVQILAELAKVGEYINRLIPHVYCFVYVDFFYFVFAAV